MNNTPSEKDIETMKQGTKNPRTGEYKLWEAISGLEDRVEAIDLILKSISQGRTQSVPNTFFSLMAPLCPLCGEPWIESRPGKWQPNCECQEEIK